MKNPVSPISLAKTFEGVEIRTTPEGHMVAQDVLKALGLKDPSHSWRDIKKRHPEFREKTSLFRGGKGGRPPEALDEQGIYRLAMVAGGPKAATFREWASIQLQRIRQADPTLTADLIDRTENTEDLKKLEVRARTRRTNKEINQTIVQHEGDCFPQVADTFNVSITGKTAKELKALRKVDQTRDGMSHMELTLIAAAEELGASGIRLRKARGNGEILGVVHEVATDIKELRRKYAGPVSIPAGDGESIPLLQVEI